MSDVELRRKLKSLNYNPGPITDATRALYEKKLNKLQAEARRSTGSSPVSTGSTSTVGRRSWAGSTAHSVTPARGSNHRNWGRGEEDNEEDEVDEDDNYEEEDDEDKTRPSVYTNSGSFKLPSPPKPREWITPAPPVHREWANQSQVKHREWITPAPPARGEWANPSPPKPREWITPAPPARKEWANPSPPKPREWITPAPLARSEWANPSPPKPREWATTPAVSGHGDWRSPPAPKPREFTPRQEWDYQEVPASGTRVSAKPLSSRKDWASPIHRTPVTSYGAFSRGPNDPPTPWARARPAWDSDGEGDEAFVKPASRAWRREQILAPNNPKPQSKCRPRALERLLSYLLAAASVALLCAFLGILFVKSAKTPEGPSSLARQPPYWSAGGRHTMYPITDS